MSGFPGGPGSTLCRSSFATSYFRKEAYIDHFGEQDTPNFESSKLSGGSHSPVSTPANYGLVYSG